MTPLEAALTYAARGWRVIPIQPGGKHPHINAWQNAATTDLDIINEWWTRWPDHGIGIATGPQSGIFVLDVDVTDGKHGDDTLADLEHQHGALPDTVEVVTGTGGRHLYFALPAGVTIRNDAGIRLGPGLDIRGEGGQVLAPPSIHPNGTAYEWEASSHPDDVDVAEPSAWLLHLLTQAPAEQPDRSTLPASDPNTPGAQWAAVTPWPAILEPDGAQFVGRRVDHRTGGSYELWARPGINGDHASATIGYGGTDLLKVFSSSWPGLTQDETYTRFGYYAATRHNGDHRAAAAALRAEGHGSSNDFSDLIETPTTRTIEHTNGHHPAPAATGAPDYPPPTPLGTDANTLPAFPLHALPDWITGHCRSVAARLEVAADLPAMLALAALAAAAAGAARVRVQGPWAEDLNLYLAVTLPPGEGKSPAETATIGPLRRFEAKLIEQSRDDIARAAQEQRLAERRVKQLEDKYTKSGLELDRRLAVDAAIELATLVVPKAPQVIADDVTVEKLAGLLADQDGRIAIISDEGGVFGQMTGRYSDKPNLDPYLKAWSGVPIKVDRVGRPADHIAHPLLTIGVTIQPSVVRSLAKNPTLEGRGLTDRFMYSWPPSRVGYRNELRVLDSHDTTPEDTWADQLATLAARWRSWQTAVELTLHIDALETHATWAQDLEDQIGPDGALQPIAGWIAKAKSSVIRVAGLLHLASDQPGWEISGATMARAVAIGDYWVAHARYIHEIWGTNDTLSDARTVLNWLTRQPEPKVTARHIWLAHRTHFDTIRDTVDVLAVLVERGWLIPDFDGPIVVGIRGKAAQEFHVHPQVRANPPRVLRAISSERASTREEPCGQPPEEPRERAQRAQRA